MQYNNELNTIDMRLADIDNKCRDGSAFTVLCHRKELNRLKKELQTLSDKHCCDIKDIQRTRNDICAVDFEMDCIANNSIEENIEIILHDRTINKIFSEYNICDVLTDEETVFLVNKKLSIKDIFTIHYDDLLCLYKNARELSSKFDADKVDAILDKLYADIKLQASKIYQPEDIYIERTIEYIDSNLCYIKNLNYLSDSFKAVVNERLKALKLLYMLN